MRVAVVAGEVSAIGSARALAVPLARALMRRGVEVRCFEVVRSGAGLFDTEGVPVQRIALGSQLLKRLPAVLLQRLARGGHQWPRSIAAARGYDAAVGAVLADALERFRPDTTYAFSNVNIFRLLAGRRPAGGLAVNLVGFGIDTSRGGAVDTFPLQPLLFRQPSWDLHVTATGFELAQYQRVYQELGLQLDRLVQLPHPVDDTVFSPGPARPALFPSEWTHSLVYPVQVYPRKNLELALASLARLQDLGVVGLVVTGRTWDGAYRARIERHAAEMSLADRLRFLNGVPTDQLRDVLRAADAVIFPSHQETYGLGLMEALACGTPVVAPAWIPACADLLADLPGVSFSQKDADQFAAAIRGSLGRHHDRAEISRQSTERFGAAAVAERFLAEVERTRTLARPQAQPSEARLAAIDWRGLYADAGDLGLAR